MTRPGAPDQNTMPARATASKRAHNTFFGQGNVKKWVGNAV